ncbi:PqqD family peptide modification chaperone [Candidatus Omnitrophota bacterium]
MQINILKRDPKVILKEEEDTGLLFNPGTGKVNTLNPAGKFIWRRLDGSSTRDEIIEGLNSRFEVSDKNRLAGDFDNFISQLRQKGMLEGSLSWPSQLKSLTFGITSKCNLSCKHCFNRNIPEEGSDMTTKKLFDVIDQLAQGGVRSISIFGGEPICHPDFKKIVEYLCRYPFSLSLNTNATLIDRDMAHWLKGHGLPHATVSFDGSNSKIMDMIRGQGAFDMCLKGIEALCEEGVRVLLSATLNKINFRDVRQMVLLGKKLKAAGIRFNHVFFGGNAPCFIKEIYLTPAEEREAIDAVWKAKEEFSDFISGSYLTQKEKFEKLGSYKPKADKIVIPPCGAARNKCAIRPDGEVTPCEIIWEARCGNLKEKSLKEIWEDSELMNSFRKPFELDLNKLAQCQGCKFQYLCFIGHRCQPYYYPGGIKDRSLYCWLK